MFCVFAVFFTVVANADQYLNLDHSYIKILGDPMTQPAEVHFQQIQDFPGEYKLFFPNPVSYGKAEGFKIDFSVSPNTGACREFGGFISTYAYYCGGVLTIPATEEVKTDVLIKRMHLDLKQGRTGKVIGINPSGLVENRVTIGKYIILQK